MRAYVFLFFLLAAPRLFAGEYGPRTAGEAAEAGLTAADIPTPIMETKVGDWAEYAHADGGTSKMTVMERWPELNDFNLIIQIEQSRKNEKTEGKKGKRKGRPQVSHETVSARERAKDMRDLGPDDFLTRREVLVKGRPLDVVVVNYVEDGKVVRQSFFSNKVPVYGLVRGVRIEGDVTTVVMNLKDFGNAGDENIVLYRDEKTIISRPARPEWKRPSR